MTTSFVKSTQQSYRLLSDNGTEFNNQILYVFCRYLGIRWTSIVACPLLFTAWWIPKRKINPLLVYPCERCLLILARVDATSNGISKLLPTHSSIGDTHHFVVLGQDKRLPYSVLLKEEEWVYDFDDYARLRVKIFHEKYIKGLDKSHRIPNNDE